MYLFPLTVDQVVQFHGEITSYAGIRQVITAGTLQIPTVYQVSILDDSECWKLRPRAVGEIDNNVSLLVPADWNGTTNNVIWCRIA